MTDEEIYELWFSETDDLRYLRPDRWKELKKVISDYKITSVLEFGSGVSTILFNNLGLKVLSVDTDVEYMKFVASICPVGPIFQRWANKSMPINGFYDLALVDGILPRTHQFRLALKHAGIIAVDDYEGELEEEFSIKLVGYDRIDSQSTILAIFEKRKIHD